MNEQDTTDHRDQPPQVGRLVGDGWSRLEVAAISMHEAFLALVSGGFTEGQALDIISKIVIASKSDQSIDE